jgi:hypothetical protein
MDGNNGTLRRVVCTARARIPAEPVVIDQETEAVTVRRDGSASPKPEPAVSAPYPFDTPGVDVHRDWGTAQQ